MVLNPISFKESKSSVKRNSVDASEKGQSKSDKGKEREDEENLIRKSKSGAPCTHDGGASETDVARRKKRRQSIEEDPSPACSRPQRKTRKKSQAPKRGRHSGGTTSSKKSPYFKQRASRGSRSSVGSASTMEEEDSEQSRGKQSSGSDSEYVPQGRSQTNSRSKKRNVSVHSNNSDDDFEQPKKKRRRLSKSVGGSPSKKLKEAVESTSKKQSVERQLKSHSKTSLRKESESPVTIDSGECSLNQSRGSSESIEIVKSEETASWAEVYLPGESGSRIENKTKKWTCVHLPSCSVNQPHLCEKHCTLPLNYVIAIENGESSYV